MGLQTAVMTGDTVARARLTAADQVLAGLTPERKLAAVRRLRRDGRRVLFVGDGVNDAAAMAESDVSIGVAGGTDLAAEVANMVWHGRDVRAISWAVQAARETVTTIRGNLVLAAGYNLAGVTLAVTGMLHPVAAALLMTCSSVVVTWRAMAGLRADEERGGFPATVETPPRLTERVAT
jgi:P-type E1-E2 ATPase